MKDAYLKSVEVVADELNTNISAGLTTEEAMERLAKDGPNSLGEEKKIPLWKKFLAQLNDAMVYVLIGAAVLSAVMAVMEGNPEGWIDVAVILAIVILNAVLGVYQEGKADEALAALKKMSSPQTKVVRDGIVTLIDSEKLVVGDVVTIDAGDAISADIRLTQSQSLKADESSLTGESVAVEKDLKQFSKRIVQ